MYKGTNKTALKSQSLISAAFSQMLQEQSFASINISSICARAGVSRQTFYTLFRSKENLVIYLLHTKFLSDAKNEEHLPTASLAYIARSFSEYLIQNQDFLTLLHKNEILHLFQDCLCRDFLSSPAFLADFDELQRKVCIDFIAGGLCGIAKNFVEYPDVSQKSLEKCVIHLFSGELFL